MIGLFIHDTICALGTVCKCALKLAITAAIFLTPYLIEALISAIQ